MKRTYDIGCFGEGIAGLMASVLLAGRGFACLWIDTALSGDDESGLQDVPTLITTELWEKGLTPLINGVDTALLQDVHPRRMQRVQCLVPGRRLEVDTGRQARDQGNLRRNTRPYLDLMTRAMTKPMVLSRAARARAPHLEDWQELMARGLSASATLDRLTHAHAQCALSGMSVLDYGRLKESLGAFLPRSSGDYVKLAGVELLGRNEEVLGLKFGDQVMKARYYFSERYRGRPEGEGFRFVVRYDLRAEVLPAAMGDLVIASPPRDMAYPLTMVLDRRQDVATLWVTTPVRRDNTLTSLTELISWAAEMVLRRVREIVPFIDAYLIGTAVIDPQEEGTIRPWFTFAQQASLPSLLRRRRFLQPMERLYACDRSRHPWLDLEGALAWGIALANAVLRELNRSDLISLRLT